MAAGGLPQGRLGGVLLGWPCGGLPSWPSGRRSGRPLGEPCGWSGVGVRAVVELAARVAAEQGVELAARQPLWLAAGLAVRLALR